MKGTLYVLSLVLVGSLYGLTQDEVAKLSYQELMKVERELADTYDAMFQNVRERSEWDENLQMIVKLKEDLKLVKIEKRNRNLLRRNHD